MSLQQLLTNVTNDLQVGSLNSLVGTINQIAKITPKQYQSNERTLQQSFPNFIQALKHSVMKNQQSLSQNIDIVPQLQQVQRKMPKRIRQKYGRQIDQVIKMANLNKMKQQYQNLRQIQTNQVQNEIINEAINQDTVGDLQIAPKQILMTKNLSPIQRSVIPYQSILNPSVLPQMTSFQRVPASISYLAKYAQIQNKIPYGSVSQKQGLCYIGVQQISNGNEKILTPYPKNQISDTKLPDIENQFKYHANRTINSWNKFIQRQAQLISFTKKVSTAKNRLQYVQKQFKSLTLQTFACQVLASLMFYYVYLPLQKFSKQLFLYPSNQKKAFFQKYPTGISPKQNPLLLKKQQGIQVAKMLLYEVKLKGLADGGQLAQNATFSSGLRANTVYLNIIQYLDKTIGQRKICQKQYKKMKQYSNKRQLEAIAFFRASGIQSLKYTNFMALPQINGVIKRRFVIKSSFTNNQYTNIIEKLTKVKQQQKKTTWDMYWGCPQIYCNDYVWGYK